jgi:hypothetical protein
MPKDLLIRDIGADNLAWLQSTKPPGTSQGEYLRSLFESIIEDNKQPSLFTAQNILSNKYSRLPFKFIDLFAGIGGFRSAMTRLGGKCVFSNEWDKYAVKTYLHLDTMSDMFLLHTCPTHLRKHTSPPVLSLQNGILQYLQISL